MKNSIKKFTAILLVVIMLMSVVSMQSFAAFEGLKKSLVEKIELSEGNPAVSLKELDNYYAMVFSMFEDSELNLDYIKENLPGYYNMIFNFDLAYSGFDYNFDVTLKSGDVYTVSAKDYSIEYNNIYDIEVEGRIGYETYLAAKEKGAKEIEVEIYGYVYNKLISEYSDVEYTSSGVLPLTEMVVKSITPVSGIPEKVYYDADYVDIEGAEFLIEYADGKTNTAKVSQEIIYGDESNYSLVRYYLDGNELDAYFNFEYDEETEAESYFYCFSYLDALYISPEVPVEESLFKGIEITECKFDAETAILSSVSYELRYQDDSTVSFTKEFTEQEAALLALGAEINAIDGYFVSVYVSLGNYDISNDTINADTYCITVTAGTNADDYEVDNPNKNVMNGALNVINFFSNIIWKIREFFNNLFDRVFFAL